jgi:hypothetical protein
MVLRSVCVAMLRAYQWGLSPFLGPACRFTPTCSEYASQAIVRYGLFRGIRLACWRLLKCHPFHPGGVDPVR